MPVPFVTLLAVLEEHGWEFTGLWTPYRVFKKAGRLPILVEVHEKQVSDETYEHVKAIIEADRDESPGDEDRAG